MQSNKLDTIIVGAGLAGAAAAFWLNRAGQKVCVLEAKSIASGASSVGYGLANPLISRKGRPVWKAAEALAALRAMGTPGENGILRPARDREQAEYFEESVARSPNLASWLSARTARDQHPYLKAPYGLIDVSSGLAFHMPSLVRTWLSGIDVRQSTRVVSWTESPEGHSGDGGVRVSLADGKALEADRLLICTGASLLKNEALAGLNLHPIKGQMIRIRKPSGLPPDLPSLSGYGYVVDEGNGVLSIGSTFEHSWETEEPTREGLREILAVASNMLSGLNESEVIEQVAKIRMTVPGARLPMIGPVTATERVWVFTGLGAKGIMMAALLGEQIPQFFNDSNAIPKACRVAQKKLNA